MRTLLLLLAMGLLAVASGLSFVVRAAAQAPGSAEMEFGCGPGPDVASGEPTLLTCTAVARNTGSTTLAGAQLEFLPAANVAPPDLYLFWSESHDGVRSVPGQAQLTYDFGDIAPGASSTIVLEIIVRSRHDFGADVALVAQPDQRAYSRTPIRGTVTAEGGATIPLTLIRDFVVTAPMTSAAYRLAIMNFGDTPYDGVTAELSPGTNVILKSDDWEASGLPGRLTANFGPLAGNSDIRRVLSIVAAPGACATAAPALVVTAVQRGITRRQPVVDDGVLLGFCGGGEAGVGALPYGGSGPSGSSAGRLRVTAAAMAAIGALCVAMGATTRHRRRGSD